MEFKVETYQFFAFGDQGSGFLGLGIYPNSGEPNGKKMANETASVNCGYMQVVAFLGAITNVMVS